MFKKICGKLSNTQQTRKNSLCLVFSQKLPVIQGYRKIQSQMMKSSNTKPELTQILELAGMLIKSYYNYIPYVQKLRDMKGKDMDQVELLDGNSYI